MRSNNSIGQKIAFSKISNEQEEINDWVDENDDAKIFHFFSMVMGSYHHPPFWVVEWVLFVLLASSLLHLVPLGPLGHSTLAYKDSDTQELALLQRLITRLNR